MKNRIVLLIALILSVLLLNCRATSTNIRYVEFDKETRKIPADATDIKSSIKRGADVYSSAAKFAESQGAIAVEDFEFSTKPFDKYTQFRGKKYTGKGGKR